MGAIAWSKATPEQRERHRQSCREAGKWRKSYNWCVKVCDMAQKLNIDGFDFLAVVMMMLENKKKLEIDKGQQIIKLLQKKMKPEKVYKLVFES